MEVSGEVADLLVREGLQVAEVALRIGGKGVVNVTALLAALAKENYKVSGKVGIDRLNKENAESIVIPIHAEDMAKFSGMAKKFGVLYAAVEKNEGGSGAVHIISNTNYAAQLNAVLEEMNYPVLAKVQEGQAAKKATARVLPERSSNERGNGLTALETEDKPSVREHLAELKTVAENLRQPQRKRDKVR